MRHDRPAPGAGGPAVMPLRLPRLLVPAYFHPAAAPDDWARMASHGDQVRLVVLNPASGPGTGPDPAYSGVLAALRAAGVAIAGYVDTDYGRRPRRDAVADIARYREWYAIDGVLFDRVCAGPEDLRHYALLARRARKLGALTVAFNHGVHPHPGYARHADILGTFEGPWSVYLEQAMPQWTRSWPPERFCHVVHSVPADQLGNALLLAARRRAGSAYVTDQSTDGHGGGNPYSGLPAPVLAPAAGPGL